MERWKVLGKMGWVARVGTLCGVLAMLVLVTGCPTGPCDVAGVCDDGDLCTTDTCEVVDGEAVCTYTPVECEEGEVCDAETGECVTDPCAGIECDDGDPCTVDECVGGECVYTDVVCEDGEVCVDGECVPVDPCEGVDYDDGLFCNGEETCDPETGEMVEGTPPCDADYCDEDNDVCLECLADDECDDDDLCTTDTCEDGVCVNAAVDYDDGLFCNGEETCDPETGEMVEGTPPCDPDTEECDEDNDICVSLVEPCTTDAECDDGLFCTGVEICEAGVCIAGTDPCADDPLTVCDEDLDECVPLGLGVTISGCPEVAQANGTSVELTATAANATGTVTYAWEATGDATFDGAVDAATATVVLGSAPTTVTVTVTDDMGTVGDDDPDPTDDETATDTCDMTIDVAVLNVVAGSLAPQRAGLGQTDSGDPGEAGNFALNGSVSQAGYSSTDFIVAWTVDSQPDGSGTVTFDNSGETDTGWRINPPSTAGMYTFRLTATNTIIGDQDSDTVAVQLLNAPTVVVKDAFTPMRQNLLRSEDSLGATFTVTYTFESAGTITVYDGTGTANADILASVTVEAGEAQDVDIAIPVGGDRITTSPQVYQLRWIGTDLAGSTAVANMTDPTEVAAMQRATIYIGYGVTETTESSTVPKIDLNTAVGELDGAGNILHQGIGADDPDVANIQRQTKVVDMNGDGYGDLVTLQTAANGVDIRYGSPSLITNDDAPGTGDDWGAVDVNVDAGGNYECFGVGDFDNDGNQDLVFVDDTTATRAVEVYLLSGSGTGAAVTTATRTYTVPLAADQAGDNYVEAGDLNGDGVDDFAVAFSEAEFDLSAGGDDDGIVGVVYGAATLPSSGNFWGDAVSGENPAGTFNGERLRDTAAGADKWGVALTVGQWNGGGGLELFAAEGAGETDIRLFTGGNGSRMATAIQREYVQEAAADMVGGMMRVGDVTGDGNGDLAIMSIVKEKIYFVSNSASDQTALSSVVAYVGTTQVNGNVWDGDDAGSGLLNDMELYDVTGDGSLDVVFGDVDGTTGDRILVIQGPVGLNNITQSDFFRSYIDGDDAVGTNIVFGDVNGDGLDDFIFGSGTELYVLVGVQ